MFLLQKPFELFLQWDDAVLIGACSSVFVSCGGASPHCVAMAPCCALRGWLNWPWSFRGSIIVCKWSRLHSQPPSHHCSSHTHTTAWSEAWGEWDVTDPARCRIWLSNPTIVLHIDLRVCAIPNCDWRLQWSQLLSTLHWTVLPESSLPTMPELINGFFQQKLHYFVC